VPAKVQSEAPAPMESLLYEVKKVIVGQDHLLERLAVALLARGHVLVEGVPGLAKTMAIKTLAAAIGGEFKRIQFTPDLVPADLIGTRIYNQKTGEFNTSLGPVFANLLLADEINRAPAKVQSALLEVMQERQVTIGHDTFKVPDPFLVMATQNPIETEGTYALPEAQIDRFMLKVLVGYPSVNEEFVIVERMTGHLDPVREVLTAGDLLALQQEADKVYVDPGAETAYQGVRREHALVLDLGPVSKDSRVVLFLNGWIFYTDTSINVSLSQRRDLSHFPPVLEVPDGNGGWKVAMESFGFPAGKTKTMPVDLTGLLDPADPRVRIRTTMAIFWDEAYMTVDDPAMPVVTRLLHPARATLEERGFSRRFRETPDGPEVFDRT